MHLYKKKMYKIILEKKVRNFLKKHKSDKIIKIFLQKLWELQDNPYNNTLNIQPLLWKNNQYRLRIGRYRFLYEINNEVITITFFNAGPRWDIYKK